MRKCRLACKKLSADSANTKTYVATMRESYGDEIADILSEVYETAESGRYYIRKDEYPSPETVRILEELGYSVENKFCESEKKAYCQVGWYYVKRNEDREWRRTVLFPLLTGSLIAVILGLTVSMFWPL